MKEDTSYKSWINSQKENFPYYNPAPKDENGQKQIPIIAIQLIYDNGTNALPEAQLSEMKEAGFNVCQQILGMEPFPLSLSDAKDVGVSVITRNAYFGYESIVQYLKDHKIEDGFGGFLLYDEPKYAQLTGEDTTPIQEIKEDGVVIKTLTLQEWYRFIMEQNPNKLVQINLAGGSSVFLPPALNSSETTQERYERYVQAYQDNFKPSYFSYDIYPVRELSAILYEGLSVSNPSSYSQEGEIIVDNTNQTFYSNLKLFADFSKRYIRPFWAYCQSLSFMQLDSAYFKPIAKEQYLRFEAFTALAYGAQGIVYWAYPNRPKYANETYLGALIDRHGRRSASWYYAQKVNGEMHKYKNVFLRNFGSFVSTKNIIQTTIYDKNTTCNIKDSINPLQNVSGTFSLTNERGIVVSRIYNETEEYLMVVSTNALEYQTLRIMINSGKITELTPIKSKGEENITLYSGVIYQRTLIPGGYRIFKLS